MDKILDKVTPKVKEGGAAIFRSKDFREWVIVIFTVLGGLGVIGGYAYHQGPWSTTTTSTLFTTTTVPTTTSTMTTTTSTITTSSTTTTQPTTTTSASTTTTTIRIEFTLPYCPQEFIVHNNLTYYGCKTYESPALTIEYCRCETTTTTSTSTTSTTSSTTTTSTTTQPTTTTVEAATSTSLPA